MRCEAKRRCPPLTARRPAAGSSAWQWCGGSCRNSSPSSAGLRAARKGSAEPRANQQPCEGVRGRPCGAAPPTLAVVEVREVLCWGREVCVARNEHKPHVYVCGASRHRASSGGVAGEAGERAPATWVERLQESIQELPIHPAAPGSKGDVLKTGPPAPAAPARKDASRVRAQCEPHDDTPDNGSRLQAACGVDGQQGTHVRSHEGTHQGVALP
jgi:hypothetical protein